MDGGGGWRLFGAVLNNRKHEGTSDRGCSSKSEVGEVRCEELGGDRTLARKLIADVYDTTVFSSLGRERGLVCPQQSPWNSIFTGWAYNRMLPVGI